MILSPFSLSRIQFNRGTHYGGPAIMVVGGRESGKTVILQDIMHQYRDVSRVVVFSKDTRYRDASYVSELHPQPTESILCRLIHEQRRRVQLWMDDSSTDPRVILVFDGPWEPCVPYCPSFQELLIMTHRLRAMCLFASTSPETVPVRIRSNMDVVMLLQGWWAERGNTLWRLFDEFTADKIALILSARSDDNWDALVIDYAPQPASLKWMDRLFWFRAHLRYRELLQIEEFALCQITNPFGTYVSIRGRPEWAARCVELMVAHFRPASVIVGSEGGDPRPNTVMVVDRPPNVKTLYWIQQRVDLRLMVLDTRDIYSRDADYVMLFRDTNRRDALFREYGKNRMLREEFEAYMDVLTDDRTLLVVTERKPTSRIMMRIRIS